MEYERRYLYINCVNTYSSFTSNTMLIYSHTSHQIDLAALFFKKFSHLLAALKEINSISSSSLIAARYFISASCPALGVYHPSGV